MADKVRSLNNENSVEAQSLFDLIFPKSLRIQAGLSDEEASFLYGLWKNAPMGSTQFPLPAEANPKQVVALKTKGYLTGFGNGIELTEKGRKVIVEMVTHEPNALEKKAQEVSYSSIKAKNANKRPIQSLVAKVASKTDKTFNLRKIALRKMKS